MFKHLKHMKNEKGLTLIELLAVIVILAIIAAIAIPAIGNIIENSRLNGAKSDAISVLNAATIYFTDNTDEIATTPEDMVDAGYLESMGKVNPAAAITKATGGHTISDTIDYSGGRTLTLAGATVAGITADNTKGSSDAGENLTISE